MDTRRDRSLLQVLGGGQTVAAALVFLALAMGAIGSIFAFSRHASANNATAVLYERAVTQLHVLLRALNETVVTEGSLASLGLVGRASVSFGELHRRISSGPHAASVADWEPIARRIDALMRDRRNVAFDDDALIALGKVNSEVEAVVDRLASVAEAQRTRALEAERRVEGAIAAVALLILAGTMGIFLGFHRNVTRPMESAIALADRVAEGDLTVRTDSASGTQVGRLLRALGRMTDRLRQIVSDVGEGTASMNTASGQLAQGNLDLSRRTERQASSLEETAATMEELSTVVDENAANSRLARAKAAEAMQTTQQAGDVVNRFLEKMESIATGSSRMADIIAVIDGIAFQTNILALNAAVEAARAGEQGRGFAVVAAEVRSLAQRSATAAREIRELIEHSTNEAATGGRMVGESRQSMEDAVRAIQHLAQVLEDIGRASEQQAASIRQASQAVMQMDQTVQQNAALVEQVAAASESLKQQAETLNRGASFFRLVAA